MFFIIVCSPIYSKSRRIFLNVWVFFNQLQRCIKRFFYQPTVDYSILKSFLSGSWFILLIYSTNEIFIYSFLNVCALTIETRLCNTIFLDSYYIQMDFASIDYNAPLMCYIWWTLVSRFLVDSKTYHGQSLMELKISTDLALIVNVFFRLDVYVLRKIQNNPKRRALLSSTAHFYT